MDHFSAAHAIVLAHCTYIAHGLREIVLHEPLRVLPPCPYLATATVVQQGLTLASMIFRSDLPLTDPHASELVSRVVGTVPALRDLLEDDPSRGLVVEPVNHRRDLPRIPAATLCRGIFLHAFLRHAAAGTA